jgi:hypothetical protein
LHLFEIFKHEGLKGSKRVLLICHGALPTSALRNGPVAMAQRAAGPLYPMGKE